jgi:hypothetical protein
MADPQDIDAAAWLQFFATLFSVAIIGAISFVGIYFNVKGTFAAIKAQREVTIAALEGQRETEWTRLRIEAFARCYQAVETADAKNEYLDSVPLALVQDKGAAVAAAETAAEEAENSAKVACEYFSILLPGRDDDIRSFVKLVHMAKPRREGAHQYESGWSERLSAMTDFRRKMTTELKLKKESD